MLSDRRVVLTGLGSVNPLANNVPEFWSALIACKSGIRRITRFDTTEYASQIGGEVQNWAQGKGKPDNVDVRDWRHMDPFAQYAYVSAMEAVADSGLDFGNEDSQRCGVVVGSGIGGLAELEDQHNKIRDKGPGRVSPFTVPKLMANAASGNIALRWGLQGVNFCVVTACASAAHSMGESCRIIQREEADVIISGGSEAALTPIGLASFCALKGLSTRNDDPEHASRPWDRGRDGFLLAEGAGIVILEELERAKKRGAKIYAELVGYGSSCDGYHITAPDPDGNGAILAVRRCLADAGVSTDDVDYINAHGTSTPLGDLAETRGIKKVFGDYARKGLMISSTKSATGHLLGASGGIEIIASALAIRDEVLPPTLNLDDPDDECDLDYIPNAPREKKVDIILSNSFGFGGHNGCLLLKRFTG